MSVFKCQNIFCMVVYTEILTIELTRNKKVWREGAIHYVANISVLRFTQGSLPDPAKAPLANADHAGAAVPTAV